MHHIVEGRMNKMWYLFEVTVEEVVVLVHEAVDGVFHGAGVVQDQELVGLHGLFCCRGLAGGVGGVRLE